MSIRLLQQSAMALAATGDVTRLPNPFCSSSSVLLSSPAHCAFPILSVVASNYLPFKRLRTQFTSLKMNAAATETEQPKWWERSTSPNMISIHSTEEFLDALSRAADRLVVVEFYGTWCASCRALFPKLCRTAEEHPEIMFLKIDYDENKPMCKRLNVKVLPYFHLYRGADGLVESFSCSLSKFWKLKDAIELHNTARHSSGPAKRVEEVDLESLGS